MKKTALLILFLFLHFFFLINLRFEAWPVMILYPWLMDKGFLLYRDIITPYPPLFSWCLFFFFKITGFSLLSLKILTWLFILLVDLSVFYFSLKFWKKEAIAFLSLGFFILWQPFLDGNGLWLDLGTTPFLLLSSYFLWQYLLKNSFRKLFLSGVFLALSFFIKQTAIWFYFLVLLIIILKKNHLRKFTKEFFTFTLPLVAVFLLLSLYFSRQNIFSDFIFWCLKFPFFIMSASSAQKQLPNFRQFILTVTPFLTFSFSFFLKDLKKEKKKYYLLLGFFLGSSLFILPRWGLFHLQPALAFAGILMGKIIYSFFKTSSGKVKLLFFLPILLISFVFELRFLTYNWHQEIRFFEKPVNQQSTWLKNHTDSQNLVFNLNGPDVIYFLADRQPIKPFVENFSWFYETTDLKTRVLKSLKENQPEVIVYREPQKGPVLAVGVYQPEEIFEWLLKNYHPYSKIGDVQFFKKNHEK